MLILLNMLQELWESRKKGKLKKKIAHIYIANLTVGLYNTFLSGVWYVPHAVSVFVSRWKMGAEGSVPHLNRSAFLFFNNNQEISYPFSVLGYMYFAA